MALIHVNTLFPTDPRVLDIGPVAEALWLRGLCSAVTRDDGWFIPIQSVARMADLDGFAAARTLVGAGLWIDANPGWIIAENDLWEPGPTNPSDRNVPEYYQWRKGVFARDDRTCQDCGIEDGEMHAHHIKPWAKHHDLRFDINNGITLCADCHRARHRKGSGS